MSRRATTVLLAVVIAATACSDRIGRAIPDCDLDQVRSEILTQAQAVPTATIGPCIIELEPGWEYEHQQAESGAARFWLSSDRMGDDFVEVTLTETCDPGAAIRRPAPHPDVEARVSGSPYVDPVPVTLVPVNGRVVEYAASIGVDLAGSILRGRPLELRLASAGNASAEITAAKAADRMVIVVDDADAAAGTLELLLPSGDVESEITVQDALDEIEDEVAEAHYDATWYFLFDGGCISWQFDAKGAEVATIEQDMVRAVGFYDLAEVRRVAGELGYFLGP